jgi:succinate dehydrogenase/fumarate reductase flavoprotein subunit
MTAAPIATRVWTGALDGGADVVVVGSGAPGLVAALSAQSDGARVAVLEKSAHFGGTSAVSGGMLWVPLNRWMAQDGTPDDRAAALAYLAAVTAQRTPAATLAAVVDQGPEMLDFLETAGGVRMAPMPDFPDYHPELEGGCAGGRSLEPVLYDGTALGPLLDAFRPLQEPPITFREYEAWRRTRTWPADLADRESRHQLARGQALVAPLLSALAAGGATLVTGLAAARLVVEDDAVVGVQTADRAIHAASAGVVLACGGFEWDDEMTRQFLPGPVQTRCSPPHNTGDGIRMAAKIGAGLRNLQEAWWQPQIRIPGKELDGAQIGYRLTFERTGPGTLIINRAGRRFVNEAHSYNDIAKVMHLFDPATQGLVNLPAFLVFDQRHLERYGFLGIAAGDALPPWIVSGDTLTTLAQRIGVDRDGLVATVQRFNAHAREGVDPDFGRGASVYDRYWGDAVAPHPALGALDVGPFHAVEVHCGVSGTKGGVATTAAGQALDAFDVPIAGLYAVGNTAAHPMGRGYPGAGGTLGPALVLARLAGREAAARRVAPAGTGGRC